MSPILGVEEKGFREGPSVSKNPFLPFSGAVRELKNPRCCSVSVLFSSILALSRTTEWSNNYFFNSLAPSRQQGE